MGNVGVDNVKFGKCFFCNLPATHLWYLVYGGSCCVFDCPMIFAICYVWICLWLVSDQCMGFLYWICLRGVLFCSFVYPFISMYTNVAWYPGENDGIIFGKKCSFCLGVLWWEDLIYLYSISAKRTDLESEMINLEDVWLAIMFMARSIAVISTL